MEHLIILIIIVIVIILAVLVVLWDFLPKEPKEPRKPKPGTSHAPKHSKVPDKVISTSASLAKLVYKLEPEEDYSKDGIEHVSLREFLPNRELPLNCHSYLFRHNTEIDNTPHTYYFFVDRGTNSPEDWVHNFLQPLGKSDDFVETARLALDVSNYVKKKQDEGENVSLIFCGHSKGGTHAALHGYLTSQVAISFNSSGLSSKTITNVIGELNIENPSTLNHDLTYNYFSRLDPLTIVCSIGHHSKKEIIQKLSPRIPITEQDLDFTRPNGTLIEVSENDVEEYAELAKPDYSLLLFEFGLLHLFSALNPSDDGVMSDIIKTHLKFHSMEYVCNIITQRFGSHPSDLAAI